jgi:hypothetical protein
MRHGVFAIAVAVLCGLGCSAPPYRLAPVSGKVTLDGHPLAEAYVSFQPRGDKGEDVPGPASAGKTDQEGRFVLAPVKVQPASGQATGAVVGKHRVFIRKGESTVAGAGDQSGQYKESLPARYNAASTLEFTVTADGTDQANFELISEP